MRPLSDLQAKILRALERQIAEDDVNFKRLADTFEMLPTGLRWHLDVLVHKGYLKIDRRGKGRNPSVKLLQSGVPLIGHIAAGPLSEALEHPEGYLKLPTHPGKFGLRVEGSSMADAIQDGDVVLLKKRPHKSGDICAVRVDHNDATLKYLDLYVNHPETVLLRPHNPSYLTAEVEAERVVVDGVFSGLLRGEVIDDLMQELGDMN